MAGGSRSGKQVGLASRSVAVSGPSGPGTLLVSGRGAWRILAVEYAALVQLHFLTRLGFGKRFAPTSSISALPRDELQDTTRELGAIMARCNVCGNEYDKSFTVTVAGRSGTFDS